MRILIAEDQKDLNKIINKRLVAAGYSVDSCFDGEEALDYMDAAQYDCLILDIMMPKKDGLAVLNELRGRGNTTPVLFLTARDAIDDKVKPFAFEELLARIRVLTRKKAGNVSNTYEAADLVLDAAAHTVKRGGKDISLSAKEFALLEYLLRNKGKVLSRTMIENSLWNFDYAGGTNAVDVYIRYLRKKIDDDFEPKLIHTVRGSGYILKD